MKASTFNSWMVKAFKMSSNKTLNQTYFIYSCDVAKGGTNLLSGLADHVAKSQCKNRTFIGTVSENGVVKTASGKGKVLVQTTGAKLQDLGLGWKGYRTLFKSKAVGSEKMPDTEVQQAVVDDELGMSLSKQFPQIGLELLYTEALEQWQKACHGHTPSSAQRILCMS